MPRPTRATCTALQAGGAERVILTDHRILPLSWTRDAYWQARLMLATWGRGGHDEDERIVADHLRWLFLRCERPDGALGRAATMPTGAARTCPCRPTSSSTRSWSWPTTSAPRAACRSCRPAPAGRPRRSRLAAALAAVDAADGLMRTDENAADDVPTYPFLLSDQVLLWHTARRIARLRPGLGWTAAPAGSRPAVRAAVTSTSPPRVRWADLGLLGQRPRWHRALHGRQRPAGRAGAAVGLLQAHRQAWQATLRFAFDSENPGFVEGPIGGLGSRHTPGTWSLGDIMGWVAFGLMEEPAADAALERLAETAFADGMLPEAYDPEGSNAAVRHWFAWPGAALGALVLDHAARDAGE